MSRLLKNSYPWERMLGCSFAENFESASAVEENGGILNGGAVVEDGKLVLDGVDSYATYYLTGSEMNKDTISFVLKFSPDFDFDTDTNINLFSTDNSYFRVVKLNGANSNALRIYAGGSIIENISSATYGGYWNVGSENILVVAGTTGSTSAWLNGTKILDADTEPWSTSRPTDLYIGSIAGSGPFDGDIHSFHFFNDTLLTDADVAFIQSGGKYDQYKDCVVNLPMTAETYDPTNSLCLDVSGNGNHFNIVGATKETKRGYLADVTQMLEAVCNALDSLPAFTWSVMINGKEANTGGNGYVLMAYESSTSDIRVWFTGGYLSFRVSNVDSAGISFDPSNYNGNTLAHLAVVFDGGASSIANGLRMFINGKQLTSVGTSGSLPATTYNFLGSSRPIRFGYPVSNPKASFLQSQIWQRALSPIEIAHLYSTQRQEVNRV